VFTNQKKGVILYLTTKSIGFAFIKNKQKPIYSAKLIERGKNKGRYQVEYLSRIEYNDGKMTRFFRKAIVKELRLQGGENMEEKTKKELVAEYNELARSLGKPEAAENTFNSKEKVISRIKELEMAVPKKREGTKIERLISLLNSKKEVPVSEALEVSGFDERNLRTACSILRNPKRTKSPLPISYDKKNRTLSLGR